MSGGLFFYQEANHVPCLSFGDFNSCWRSLFRTIVSLRWYSHYITSSFISQYFYKEKLASSSFSLSWNGVHRRKGRIDAWFFLFISYLFIYFNGFLASSKSALFSKKAIPASIPFPRVESQDPTSLPGGLGSSAFNLDSQALRKFPCYNGEGGLWTLGTWLCFLLAPPVWGLRHALGT